MDPIKQDADRKGEAPSIFDKISFYLLLALVLFLPLAFFPELSVPFAKVVMLTVATLAIFILSMATLLKRGSFFMPKSVFLLSAAAIPAVLTLSSFFSGDIKNSFFGTSLDIGTAISVIFGVTLLFLTSRIIKTKGDILSIYAAFFASFILVAIYQTLHMVFGPNSLSFGGIFSGSTANLIGKWNELGIFFGLGTILSLTTLEFLKPAKSVKIACAIALAISIFFMFVVNLYYIFVVIGLFSLASCVYLYWVKKKLAMPSLIIFSLSIIFLCLSLYGTGLRSHLPASINPAQLEVSPSWSYTVEIAAQSMKANPLLGTGPNRFQNEWFLYRPAQVNFSNFWNIDFSYGVGLIPTYMATGGILGILAWLVFFILFLWLGYKTLFSDVRSLIGRYIAVSSFFAALYLWIFNIIYTPTAVLFTLAFIFTGIFVSVLYEEGKIGGTEIAYAKRKLGFLGTLILIVLILGAASLLYNVAQKTLATFDLDKGTLAFNDGDTDSAIALITKAVSLDPEAAYYRSLAQIYFNQATQILAQQNVSQSTILSEFEPVWSNVIDNAQNAVVADENDYQNYLMVGDIYEAVLPYGYKDAYSLSNVAYQKALSIDPTNPLIYVSLAQLEAQNKNIPQAETYINDALQEKPNYSDAIYLLSQIQLDQGDLTNAIKSVTAMAELDPTDPTVFFQLGYLEYSDKSYTAAIQALGQAIALQNDYSNARYFLGLSYAATGDTSDAIAQLTIVQQLNPSNQDVKGILASLKKGTSAASTPKTPAKQ